MSRQANTGQNNRIQYLMAYLKKIVSIRLCNDQYIPTIRGTYTAILFLFLFFILLTCLVAGTDDRNRIEKLSKPDYEFINYLKLDKIYRNTGKGQ